ncbi:uncharacterized protein LOC110040566 [Orbicella faveolata]|uniref:uncharacterized protein LOC110040566 n=1 Tax=Orbicella faveolata TaxID=48498 RepID=UPI0009E1F633|nr:uncharacterized protein LOC110040566 [Orbicella faveolata]
MLFTRLCCFLTQVRKQCHADSTPLVLFRYRPTKNAMTTLRSVKIYTCGNESLLTTGLLELLMKCNLHAALQGSDFDDKGKHSMLLTSVMNIMSYVYTVCENKKSTSTSTNMDDMEIRILYPTLSLNKMVVGSIVADLKLNEHSEMFYSGEPVVLPHLKSKYWYFWILHVFEAGRTT